MNDYFNNPAAVAKLQAVANTWFGTKFMPNACIKGGGVSCQMLAGAIYAEVGFLPGFNAPSGPMSWSNAHKNSRIAAFMDAHPQFEALPGPAKYQAGDMVGFKILNCVQHCGIVLTEAGQFIHCFRPNGVQFSQLKDATFMNRLERIWRPKK